MKTNQIPEEIKNKAEDLKTEFTKSIQENSEKIKNKLTSAEQTISSYVQENPWKGLAIGVAVGALAAKCLGVFGRHK